MERLNQGKSGRRFVLRHAVGDLLRKAGSYIDGSKFLCCYIALLGPDNHDLDAIKDLCSRVIAGLRRLAVDEPLRTRILERAAGHVLPEELGAQLLLERAVELTRSLAHLNATGRALGGKHYLGTDADFLALFGTDAAYAREKFLILEETNGERARLVCTNSNSRYRDLPLTNLGPALLRARWKTSLTKGRWLIREPPSGGLSP